MPKSVLELAALMSPTSAFINQLISTQFCFDLNKVKTYESRKMPFMKGKSPIRRTLRYLNAGRLALKDDIKIFSLNYNTHGAHHNGARYVTFSI